MRGPTTLRVGAKVHAQDAKGYWYEAKVVAVGSESKPKFFVKFLGFTERHNEWVPKTRIRQNQTKTQIVELNAAVAWGSNTAGLDAAEGTWNVDQIIGKKTIGVGIKYQCTWEGWDASQSTWEPKRNLPSWLVAEYEAKLKPEVIKRGKSPAAAAPRGPFVDAETEGTDPEARRQHAPVTLWIEEVARDAACLLPRQKIASLKQISRMLCPAWAFVDIRHQIFELAAKLELPVSTAELVTSITSEKGAAGGKHVTDVFYVTSYDVVHALMGKTGTDALVLRENNTAVMLVPPLKFAFRTVRATGPTRCQLIVTGEFACFVWGSRVWNYVQPPEGETEDEQTERGAKEYNHSRAIATAVTKLAAATEGVVPAAMLAWLQVVVNV